MIIKVRPDKEKAKSMLKLVENRIKTLPFLKKAGFPTIVAESYYEIIKELLIILLLSRGFKSVGGNFHKDIFEYLHKKKIFSPEEFYLINDLRLRRNKSYYQGEEISKNFLDAKQTRLNEIIKKLKFLLKSELNEI